MRKVLLMAALCMAATLVFAPMAVAQDDLDCPQLSEAEEQAVFNADPSDPNGLDANNNGVPCEDDNTDDGSFALPTDEDDPQPDDDQYSPDDGQYSPDDSQYQAEIPVTEPNTVSPTAETETVVLPDTGGPNVAAYALPSLALLVAGGIFAARLVRRR